ncbi:MAG: DGQHR domain-containing protein [Pseudomonadota bacterium]
MEIQVIEGQPLNSGIRVFTGSIDVASLSGHSVVPYRDALASTGYQRRPQPTRVSGFASELRKGRADVPTSILLNLREARPDAIVERDGNLYFSLQQDVDQLYVVDGQHRFLAFKTLFEENPHKWGSYKLQFVLMLNASKDEEVHQFYVVNTTAKSVKTDLALDLLRQQAEADGRVMHELLEKGQKWKVEGQKIVDTLYSESEIWAERIQLANQPKGRTIIPAASYVSSLKTLLTSSPYFEKLSHSQRVGVIDAYWTGIRRALPEPFEQNSNHFALQKGVGVTAMHEILPTVIEIVKSQGDSVFDPQAYEDLMEPVLDELSGDNTAGENVNGAQFWLTAPKGGAAGSYSSSAGKRVLFAKLKNLLPPIKVM